MVKILSCLLFLLLLKASNVWSACYASQWQNGQPVYGSLYVTGSTTIGQCQALACQIYPTISGCYTPPPQVVTCTYSAVTEFRSCPVNYSGSQTWKSEINCPNGQYGQPMPSGWFKIADTCTPSPPSCVANTESKVESCPVNFSGQKTYQKTNLCPDPYGSPVQGQWILTSDTCTPNPPTCKVSSESKVCPLNQSGSNVRTSICPDPYGQPIWGDWVSTCSWNPPSCKINTETQMLSCPSGYTGTITQTRSSNCPDPYGQPILGGWVTSQDTCVKSLTNPTNVTSPFSPISPTSVLNQSISTPAPTTQSAPATAPMNVQTMTTTQTQTDTKTESTGNSNKNTMQTIVGNLIKFEIISQPSIKQYDVFPIISIGQEIPESIRRNQDLYFQFIQGDTVDFGGEQDMRMNAIKQFNLEYENGFE